MSGREKYHAKTDLINDLNDTYTYGLPSSWNEKLASLRIFENIDHVSANCLVRIMYLCSYVEYRVLILNCVVGFVQDVLYIGI